MLLLLFILVPLVEFALLIKIGAMLGLPMTLLLVIGTAIVGSTLARQQGLSVLQRLQSELAAGRQPTDALLEGFLVFASGLVLLLPGFLSDALGLLCLIPATRRPILGFLKRQFAAAGRAGGRVHVFRFGGSAFGPGATPPGAGPGAMGSRPGERAGSDGHGPAGDPETSRRGGVGARPGPGAGPPDPAVRDLQSDDYEVRRDD